MTERLTAARHDRLLDLDPVTLLALAAGARLSAEQLAAAADLLMAAVPGSVRRPLRDDCWRRAAALVKGTQNAKVARLVREANTVTRAWRAYRHAPADATTVRGLVLMALRLDPELPSARHLRRIVGHRALEMSNPAAPQSRVMATRDEQERALQPLLERLTRVMAPLAWLRVKDPVPPGVRLLHERLTRVQRAPRGPGRSPGTSKRRGPDAV